MQVKLAAGAGILVVLFWAAIVVGCILNIFGVSLTVINTTVYTQAIIIFLVAQVVGIFVPFLGAVLGWAWLFM